jgi:hypothetical protein
MYNVALRVNKNVYVENKNVISTHFCHVVKIVRITVRKLEHKDTILRVALLFKICCGTEQYKQLIEYKYFFFNLLESFLFLH